MRRPVLLLALLALVVPAFAGDAPDAAEVARKFLSADAAERKAADEVVAAATAEMLRAILASLRDELLTPVPEPAFPEGSPLVTLEVRFLDAELAVARDLGLADEHGEITSRVLTPEELARLDEAILEGGGVTLLTAPRLTVYDRQKANITVTNQTSYIQDFDVEEGVDGRTIADPIVATLSTGASLEVTPRIAKDPAEILLDLKLEMSDLVRPMAQFTTKLGATEVTIQLPEVRAQRLEKRVAVPTGRTTIVGGWSRTETDEAGKTTTDRRLVVLMSAEAIAADEVEIAPRPR